MSNDSFNLDYERNRQGEGNFVVGAGWRTASSQRQLKREQRRHQLKQQRQLKSQSRGFGS